MERTLARHEAIDHGDALVHDWRAAQLKRLGIPAPLAEIYADCVDWHQIARLVQHGCPRSSPCASSADAGCEDPAR
jgi:hypothetical protein